MARVDSLAGTLLISQAGKIGYKKPVGNVGDTAEVDLIQIGDTLLKKSLCEVALLGHLEVGREACLYIFRHYHWTPIVLGIKYADDGTKHLASSQWIKRQMLQYSVVWPIVSGIGGAISGGLLGAVIGIGKMGIELGAAGGLGYGWWIALRLWKNYKLAKED